MNPSLDSLLLTLLSTQTPEAIRTEGSNTVLTFSGKAKPGEYCQKVEVSRGFGRTTWYTGLDDPRPTERLPENYVWARIQPGWNLCTTSEEVAEAFDACLARTEPIKQAEIIAALKSLTATP